MAEIQKCKKNNIGQCWECVNQTKEIISDSKKYPMAYPYCKEFRMQMTGIYTDKCEYFKGRGT